MNFDLLVVVNTNKIYQARSKESVAIEENFYFVCKNSNLETNVYNVTYKCQP